MLNSLFLLDIDPNITIGALDLVLFPFYLAVIISIAIRFRNRHYPNNHPYRSYFLPALVFKLIGAIAISLIYVYYYEGGDTISYFFHGKVINSALQESFSKWANLMLSIPTKADGDYYEYTRQMWFYGKGATHIISAISGFISLFCFDTLLPTALIFAVISFTGIWALFRTFARLYPKLIGPISTATLFIPSVALWGSGIFKDTLILCSLGWMTYSVLQIMAFRNYSLNNLLVATLTLFITYKIKVYVIISFLPPILLWALLQRSRNISNKQFRTIAILIGMGIMAGALLIGLTVLEDVDSRYALDSISTTSETTRNWISYSTNLDGGSGYDLGTISPGIGGIISKFPQAVNVTLFRPYLWEARKVIVFLTSFESLALLLITFRLFQKVRLKKILQTIGNDNTIQFCVFFSLIFAFSVGISSYNFGALSRYKIPCIPFYLLAIILIYYRNAKPGERLLKPLGI